MNTSHKGQSRLARGWSVIEVSDGSSGGLALGPLQFVCHCGFTHPCTLIPRIATILYPLHGNRSLANPERLRGTIKILAMTGLILNLGEQDRLAPQGRRARDPVALGQHADNFAVGVLADLADQRTAVGLGHSVLDLDKLVRCNARLECSEKCRIFGYRYRGNILGHLGRVHWATPILRLYHPDEKRSIESDDFIDPGCTIRSGVIAIPRAIREHGAWS